MNEEQSKPTRKDLEIRPRPRVKRLNRASLALVAIGAILILWTALWALGRKPAAPEHPRPPQATARALDVDRLQRTRAQRAEELGSRLESERALPALPPPPPPPPRVTGNRTDPEAIRAQRALDASPVLAAFEKPTFYPSAVELRRGEGGQGDAGPRVDRGGRQGAPETAAPSSDQGLETHREQLRPAPGSAYEAPPRPPILRHPPPSPFTLLQGSYLPAVLTAGIHSDLPGQTTALVRENVYDSVTGSYLLIPSGARLLGTYDSRIAYGQKRVLVAWDRLVFPDGSSLDLGRMPGADLAGEAGVRDRVNNHFVRTFGQALLLSAFSAGAQLSQPQESSSFGGAPSARQIATAALGQEVNRTASLVLRRNLELEPTLEIRPGKLFFVQLTADLSFLRPYS